MEDLSNISVVFYVLLFGLAMVVGLIWELKRRNNIKDLKDTIYTAILYLIYFIGFSLLLFSGWKKPIYYIFFAVLYIVIYGAISWIRKKNRNISNKSI